MNIVKKYVGKGKRKTIIGMEREQTTSEYEKGDIDNSGKVDLTDALLSLKAALGIIELDDEQAAAAEVNGDNSVDLTDTVMILKIALGISAE